MTHYELAKLVQWAGPELNSRKRLQKVVYLLQSAGAPLEASYTLHHYGPYSQEVAQLSDEMVVAGLLVERPFMNAVGVSYAYSMPPRTQELLKQLEEEPAQRNLVASLAPFETQAKALLVRDLWELEVASTIAYFRRQGLDWAAAVQRACEFKKVKPNDPFITRVADLACDCVREPVS